MDEERAKKNVDSLSFLNDKSFLKKIDDLNNKFY